MTDQEVQQPEPFDAQFVLTNYHKLSGDQIDIILASPTLQPALLSVISKCHENQLKQIVRRMNLDQIKLTIPKLQLQQTGVCVQVMSPAQIRKAVVSLTSDDRHILKSNISLLSSCTNKDELQSFVSFIDPLAMCVAVESAELCRKIIDSAASMTVEQVRVVIPLLDILQIRDICKEIKEDLHLETVISMIDADKREHMIKTLENDLGELQNRQSEIVPRLKVIKEEELPQLTSPMSELSSTCNKQEKYNEVVRQVKNLKTEIESIQRSIRDLQSFLPFPIKYISQDKPCYAKYLSLETELKGLARDAYSIFISIDKAVSELNSIWHQMEPFLEDTSQDQVKSPESVYEDERAILLYEAVKEIGNPEAVANIYSMTWNQIIQAGFRSADDFKRKGVANLEQLQKYIDELPTA